MKQLILNPVENLPALVVSNKYKHLHGLYVSDKTKTDEVVKESIIGFSGREKENLEIKNIYNEWKEVLNVEFFSMRLLSGLHAHTTLFMGLGDIGDTVMILPVEAGGHFSTNKILTRLGYNVIEAIPDFLNYSVDFEQTYKLIKNKKPSFIFIDRSEGIYYEDFSQLINTANADCGTMFDASQYLTNIIANDFKSPFDMGFDLMMSTLHKNFPGPQKAMVCSKSHNKYWDKAIYAVNNYVSNIHVEQIYMAGDIISKQAFLKKYSRQMLANSIILEKELFKLGIPVILKDTKRIPTHHIWINFDDKDKAFDFYKKMERCGLLVNYRKLPYNLGYGIRMGTSAASIQGINESNINELASIINTIYITKEIGKKEINNTQDFLTSLNPLS